jgi:seryl-tRNA synthetase
MGETSLPQNRAGQTPRKSNSGPARRYNSRVMPRFDSTDIEKLVALIGQARELRAQTRELKQKSEALKQQIAQVRREREKRRAKSTNRPSAVHVSARGPTHQQ